MIKEIFFVTCVLAAFLIPLTYGAERLRASEPRTLVIYLDKPTCIRPVALDLPSSFKTPLESGLTVWVCR